MPTILAAHSGAARSRCALVAGTVADVAKIGTPGTLKEVASHRCLIAYLRTRGVEQCLGDERELRNDGRVSRDLCHGRGRAEPEALRSNLDAIVEKACEADQPLRPSHILLQKLHHIGATGDVFGGCVVAAGLSAQSKRSWKITRAFEDEGVHGSTSPHGAGDASRVLDCRDDVIVSSAAAQV